MRKRSEIMVEARDDDTKLILEVLLDIRSLMLKRDDLIDTVLSGMK